MDKLERLSDRICYIRKKRRISQERLSELMNVSRSAVGQWEGNRSSPSVDKLAALASVTGASAEWLLTGRGPIEFDVWLEGVSEVNSSPYAVTLTGPAKQLLKKFSDLPEDKQQAYSDIFCQLIDTVIQEPSVSE